MNLPKGLQKLLDDPRIESISDERDDHNGFFVYLKSDYISRTMECGTIHEMSVKACIKAMDDVIASGEFE